MKKILLAAAFFAVVSTNAFSAACVNGTLASLNGVTCTVTNGAASWDLSTFGLGAGGAAQTGYNAVPTASDIFVSFATGTNPNGGGLGFSVSFSDAAGGNNYFSTISGQPNQTVSWKTIFVATANNAGSNISEVANTVTGGTTTVGNNGSIVLQKIVTDPLTVGNPTISDGTILTASQFQSTNPLTVIDNQNRSQIGIVDNYQISAGNNGSASLTSYTNSFYAGDPQQGIPEPMTFVLMGAGLVGIAALRRRNG